MCNTFNTVYTTNHNGCGCGCGGWLWNLLFGNYGCGCGNAWNTQRVCRDACGNLRVYDLANCYNRCNTTVTNTAATGTNNLGYTCFGLCGNTNTATQNTTATTNGYGQCGCYRQRTCNGYVYDV